MEKARVLAAHHAGHAHKSQNHGQQAEKPHPPVKGKEQNHSRYGRHHRRRQIRQLMGQQVLCESRIVIDDLPEPSRLVPRKESQRKLQNMSNSCMAHIPRRAESGDMRTHQRRKVNQDIGDGKPDRHPAPPDDAGGSRDVRVGSQHISCRQPYTHIRNQAEYRRDPGKSAAQKCELLMPSSQRQQS